MAPGPDGGQYILVVDPGTIPPGEPQARSDLTLLDADGHPRAGWPIALVGWYCGGGAWGLAPLATAEGSIRLVCLASTGPDAPWQAWAFAFDAAGRSLPGWPVDLPSGADVWPQMSVVGDSLIVLAKESEWDEAVGDFAGPWWLVVLAKDGSVRTGARADAPDADGYGFPLLSPDGIAYQLQRGKGETKIRTLALRPDGGVSALATGTVPAEPMSTWSGAGPSGPAVVLAANGSAFLLSDGDELGRLTIYALDRSGRSRSGWPYRDEAWPQWQGSCPPMETGCGTELAVSAVGPGDVLYVPLAGGSLVALGPDGRVRRGWPVVLGRAGSEFWSVIAGGDGTVYALAVEPESGDATSSTVLAIDPDGTVRYRATVVDP